ncbi:glutathione S-transferase U17-like [Salvia miltiorrhiza]|uniref:glutathione S-transferase U17-like n=1 Tax=Salvia miltiorrhiza TaxID=226208 RepID=UPI0025AD65C6|nr:glutathione S-transferase U17-like [Salvia miltiorrhiza]XP_057777071.1 glutathione S-transferase U17-like [Salvia miltiorrhiza]
MMRRATSGVELLGSWASPYSIRVQIALNLKSIPYEFIEEKFYTSNKSARLLEANPIHKKIPVLIHDQKPISESLIILQYIDEAWPSNGPPILPSDPYDRAIARFWAAYVDEKWFPAFKELEKASGDEARGAIVERIHEGAVLLEEAFVKCSRSKAYFGGDSLGYIDVVLGSYLGWIELTESATGLKILEEMRTPRLARWAARLSLDDAAKDVLPDAHKLLEFYMMVQHSQKQLQSIDV